MHIHYCFRLPTNEIYVKCKYLKSTGWAQYHMHFPLSDFTKGLEEMGKPKTASDVSSERTRRKVAIDYNLLNQG